MGSLKHRIYIHPTCYSSYTLVKYLLDRGLINEVNIVDTSNPSSLDVRILSVPWVTLGSRVIAADPVTGSEIESMIRGAYKPVVDNPLESFLKTLLASSYASSLALLHGDVSYAVFRELVEASLRTYYSGVDPESVAEILRREGRSLYESLEVKLAKVLAVNYVRELYWASSGTLSHEMLVSATNRLSVTSWLLAKASIGRVGLPGNPLKSINVDGVELVISILEAEGSKIVEGIRREQETIFSDMSYISYLTRLKA